MNNLMFSMLLNELKMRTNICIDSIPWESMGKLTMINDLKKGLLDVSKARQNGRMNTVQDYMDFMEVHFPVSFMKGTETESYEDVIVAVNPNYQRE